MDIKTKSYLVIGIWITYTTLFYLNYPKIINMLLSSGFFVGVLIYLLTNPAYQLLIFGIIKYSKHSKIKASIASILLIFAFDMVASPRILVEEIMSATSSSITNLGAITIKSMYISLHIPIKLGYFLYYWFLPILFMWLSLELLGIVDFIKKIKGGV